MTFRRASNDARAHIERRTLLLRSMHALTPFGVSRKVKLL